MTVMSGGFGLSGNPENLITALKEDGVRNITIISNNCGADGFGLWVLLNNGQIRKMISSYVGEHKLFAELYLSGKLELELNPDGPLAARRPCHRQGVEGRHRRQPDLSEDGAELQSEHGHRRQGHHRRGGGG